MRNTDQRPHGTTSQKPAAPAEPELSSRAGLAVAGARLPASAASASATTGASCEPGAQARSPGVARRPVPSTYGHGSADLQQADTACFAHHQCAV